MLTPKSSRIPTMLPWHIKLSKGFQGTDGTSGALMSIYEMENRRRGPMNVTSQPVEPRNALFGLSGVSFAPQQVRFKGQHQAIQNVHKQQVRISPIHIFFVQAN